MDWYISDIAILLFMAVLTLRPWFLDGPLEKYEESVHLSWVQGIFSGKRPYRDYYINYGPLYTYHFYWFHCLLEKSLRTHRLVMAVGNYLSLVVAYSLGTFVLSEGWPRLILAMLLPLVVVDQKALTCWGGFRVGSGLLACIPLILALSSGSLWLYALAGVLAVLALLYSFDEGCTALATFPLALGALLVLSDTPFSDLMHSLLWYTAGAAIPAFSFFVWLLKNNAVRAYFQDTVLGVLRMNSWRGGSVYLPKPFLYAQGMKGRVQALFSEDCFFYWSIAFSLIVVFLTGRNLLSHQQTNNPAETATLILLLFGVLHLATSWRLANGPQFKTFLPVLIVLGCAAIYDLGLEPAGVALSILLTMMALSSGNIRFWYCHYRGRIFYPLQLDYYSGVRMPAPMTDFLAKLEAAIRKHAKDDEVLFVPYDASMSFFADVHFYSRNSIVIGEKLFPVSYQNLLKKIDISPPKLIIFEPDAPDLLPRLSSRSELEFIYSIIGNAYSYDQTIYPEKKDHHFRERSVTLWPGSWFWFVHQNYYRMYPTHVVIKNTNNE